jgi:HrpA-like RNA helicase
VFKLVLATNVAETSITIDDVSVVVDCGRAKEMSHDPERGILRLQAGRGEAGQVGMAA